MSEEEINNLSYDQRNEGDECMSGLAINCSTPFISNKRDLKGKPMSKQNKERRDFIKSHEFCMSVDRNNMSIKVSAKEK